MVFLTMVLLCACGTAYGQPMTGTGRQTLEALTPEGQYVGFEYQVKEETVFCGIHVKRLVFEFRTVGKGPDAKQIIFVHELNPVNNKVEYAYKKDGSKTPLKGETTFSDLDYSSGHIYLTIANLPLSEPNKRFKALLNSPWEGTLQPVQKGKK